MMSRADRTPLTDWWWTVDRWTLLSLIALGILCTALAFLGFFALIGEVGPVRAPLFTYVNPIVAILLGVVLLGEALSTGLLVGFPLVIVGCWLAATGGRLRPRRPADGVWPDWMGPDDVPFQVLVGTSSSGLRTPPVTLPKLSPM